MTYAFDFQRVRSYRNNIIIIIILGRFVNRYSNSGRPFSILLIEKNEI